MSREITVGRLHKILSDLITDGHARKPIRVYKPTFHHPLENDGVNCLPVHEAHLEFLPRRDGDGFSEYRKDGSEAGEYALILWGILDQDELNARVQREHAHWLAKQSQPDSSVGGKNGG